MSKPLDQAHGSPANPLELIEAYLDDSLDDAGRQRFEAHLAASAELREELRLAERIRGGLQALPALECPSRITQAVLAHAQAERAAPRTGFLDRLAELLAGPLAAWWRPALAGAALLALAFVLVPREPRQPVANAEVARAEQDVKLALAYLGQIGQRASHQVSEEVLGHRLVEPVARTVNSLSGRPASAGASDHAL